MPNKKITRVISDKIPLKKPSERIEEIYFQIYNSKSQGGFRNHASTLESRLRAIILFLDEQAGTNFKKFVIALVLSLVFSSPAFADLKIIQVGDQIKIVTNDSARRSFYDGRCFKKILGTQHLANNDWFIDVEIDPKGCEEAGIKV